jgi:hypothetical protein
MVKIITYGQYRPTFPGFAFKLHPDPSCSHSPRRAAFFHFRTDRDSAQEPGDDQEGLPPVPLYSGVWIHMDEASPLTVVTETAADPILTETGK